MLEKKFKNPICKFYGYSDIGEKRTNNEDVIASLPEHNFFAIADGMGGHNAGEIAAKEATTEMCQSIIKLLNPQKSVFSQKQIIKNLHLAINNANKKVFSLGKTHAALKGMGTTLCCLYLHNNIATYAHVGDSRIYLFRNHQLKQLTQDHSLVHELKASNKKQKKEIPSFYKNIITKAIGTNAIIEPSINFENFFPKDIYFMCTDGLSDFLSEKEMANILKQSVSRRKSVQTLIEAAKKNGSTDNITILLIEIVT